MAARAARRGHPVTLRRIYDAELESDTGQRVLVDRLWPRGVRKAGAAIDEWLQDAAPSTELRRWYDHDVEGFDEFARRYRAELRRLPASRAVDHLHEVRRTHPLTLVTATRDIEHSAAAVLLEHLTRRAAASRLPRRRRRRGDRRLTTVTR